MTGAGTVHRSEIDEHLFHLLTFALLCSPRSSQRPQSISPRYLDYICGTPAQRDKAMDGPTPSAATRRLVTPRTSYASQACDHLL